MPTIAAPAPAVHAITRHGTAHQYFEIRLHEIIEKLVAHNSVYSLAHVCDAIEMAIVDSPLAGTARIRRHKPTARLTAADFEETAREIYGPGGTS